MVHLEFGQDRLTEPQPLNTLELAQGAIKGPFEARFVSAVGGCQLLQFRVLGLGLLQNGYVGVGVFPECEEILVRGASFCGVALQGVGASKTKMGQCTRLAFCHRATVVKDFLKLSRCSRALLCCQISLATHVRGINTMI
jgi:hypothetical protein